MRLEARFSGTQLDGYRLGDLLGEGHTHEVYRAEDDSGRSFALKVPRMPWPGDVIVEARRDYAVLRTIDDPHVVRIHDFVIGPNGPCAVYELIDRQPIAMQGPLPWRRALEVVRQMCEPLHALAEHRWFSRKLSTRHVFLESRAPGMAGGDPYRGVVESADFVKIAFGTNAGAAPPALETEVRGYFGELDCTAPEVLGGNPGVASSYVFTLGVVAYYLMTGRFPFGDLSLPARFLPATFHAPSALVPEVPMPVDNIVRSCIAYEPERRYPTTLILRDAIVAFR